MREYIVFVTVILVVAGTWGGCYAGSIVKNGVASSSSSCSVPVAPQTLVELSNNTEITSAYEMDPGSTATICVTYTFDRAGTFAPSTYPLQCGPYRAANRTIIWNCPGEVTIIPSIQPFDHLGQQSLTMAYTLLAPTNDNGVYWFWLDCGDVLPILVGASPASLVFPITPGCIYEPNAPGTAAVVGVSDIGVVMVPVG